MTSDWCYPSRAFARAAGTMSVQLTLDYSTFILDYWTFILDYWTFILDYLTLILD